MNANTSAIQGLLPSLRSYGIVCERLRKTRLAPRAGFEPATNRLTAGCSTTELPGKMGGLQRSAYNKAGRALQSGAGRGPPAKVPPRPSRDARRRSARRELARRPLEATAGIEPAYPVLQTGASPLRHVASDHCVYRSPLYSTTPHRPRPRLALRMSLLQKKPRIFRASRSAMIDFATARRHMVDGQIRTANVTDLRILAAMAETPRERFLPAAQAGLAYLDLDAPVGAGRRLLKPMVFAKLVQALQVTANSRVLDLGCATGYGAAVLARLAGRVVALEQEPTLSRFAQETLAGLPHVTVVSGPL